MEEFIMSSRAGKESKRLHNQKVFTIVQLLYIMEEAKKKPFLKRVKCCFFYLFFKRFDIFFQD